MRRAQVGALAFLALAGLGMLRARRMLHYATVHEAHAAPPAAPPPATSTSTSTSTSTPAPVVVTPGTDALKSVPFSGVWRNYHLHLPAGAPPAAGWPVVVNLHGFTSSALDQMALTQMNGVADREKFIVLYPEGSGRAQSWNGGTCCGDAIKDNVDDVGFIRIILNDVAKVQKVDPKRVFATGMSNGGFLSHRLACELSDRIAAVAPVAGVLGISTCTPSRPVSVLQFQGTADELVLYNGRPQLSFPGVEPMMADWAKRDGCGTAREQTYRQGEVTCEHWTGCPKGVDVELCKVEGGGHTWPGGKPVPRLGKTTADVSATERMWQFFKAHPM